MNASVTSNNLGLKGNTSLAEAVMVYEIYYWLNH